MARLEIPCLILDEDELKHAATVGEWRQDRHNLEAARIFGGTTDTKFPNAFQRPRRLEAKPQSLMNRIKTTFRIPSVSEHQASPASVDAKNIVGLRPDVN